MFHLYQFTDFQEHFDLSVVQSQVSFGKFAERPQLNIANIRLLVFCETVQEKNPLSPHPMQSQYDSSPNDLGIAAPHAA